MEAAREEPTRGIVFNIQRFCVHDGPGIRTCIFLKGCPLRCTWCSNPEGQIAWPEVEFYRERCLRCGRCGKECPAGALGGDDQRVPIVDRSRCRACGGCQAVCPAEAIRLIGRTMTVEEVIEEALKDQLLFRNSGGGITLTGGEPLMQASFSIEVARRARTEGIHTAIETSATARWEVLEEALAHIDLVLCDLKVVDEELAQRYLGYPAAGMIENVRKLDEMGKPVVIRIPLIPQITDTLQNLQDLIRFLEGLSHIPKIDLLPYHDLGRAKYARLDREYSLSKASPHTPELIQEIRALFSSHGFETALRGDRI